MCTTKMNIVREYGHKPFQAIVLHGGPGAPGCAAGLCRGMLERRISVLEHLQTAHTIDGLIEEILSIMNRYAIDTITLVGHSFGTWLALLFTELYPMKVNKVILTGCAPLEAKYLQDIIRTREERTAQGKDDTDNYCALSDSSEDMLFFNEAQHKALMAEAFALRENGEMLQRALRVTCPVVAIHGSYDPHPVEGIRAPLENKLPQFRMTVLEQCGHDPWNERYARTPFFELLEAEMANSC